MLKDFVNIGNIPLLVEYIKSEELTIKHSTKFVMLRQYDINTDIAYDKDIYFIEEELYVKYWEKESGKTNDLIIFPINLSNSKNYSSNIYEYLPNSNESTLNCKFDNHNTFKDWYKLCDKDGNDISIKCDKIKIYKPHNRNNVNYVIDVTNIVNDITFHYFCQLSNKQHIYSDKEVVINNNIYYEYFYFYIPDVHDLFFPQKVWFVEDLNLSLFKSIENGIEQKYKNINLNNNQDLFPLSLLLEPFYIEQKFGKEIKELNNCDELNENIEDDDKYYVKIYQESSINSNYNIHNIPLNIVCSHYDTIDSMTKYYISSINVSPAICSFIEEHNFYLNAILDFDDNGILSLVSTFIYPTYIEDFKTDLLKAYLYFNKISIEDYSRLIEAGEVDNLEKLPDDIYEELEKRNEWVENIFDDESINDIIKFNNCGYFIEISTDPTFENVIYKKYYMTKFIQNFSFSLDNIFYDWKQYPDILFIRSIFIDKCISQFFISNVVPITKEKFKYCINDTTSFRLKNIIKKQSNLNMPIIDSRRGSFNFIDKINCVIKRNNDNSNNNINLSNKEKIFIKPIFYKTQDLQNIKIRYNVTQNIGINLDKFLTKVETFKLLLNNLEFTEFARNEGFVIFKINASVITNSYGKYDIVNQDNEYISSGNYELY